MLYTQMPLKLLIHLRIKSEKKMYKRLLIIIINRNNTNGYISLDIIKEMLII